MKKKVKPKQVIIKGSNVIEYLKLKKQGYKTVWVGEGKICLEGAAA